MNLFKLNYLIPIVFVFAIFSCSSQNDKNESEQKGEIESAICVLQPTEGSDVNGIVKFTRSDDGIKITADVEGLTPGKHGFHIHQYGDCSAPDGTSTGGHFNPTNKNHGSPDAEERHIGDLGNLIAGDNGKAHYERVDKVILLNGPNSIIGRGIIVHGGEDDLITQPTGNAGSRLAFGVIGLAK